MSNISLRAIERALLRTLERDARSPLASVGKRHHASQQRLSYTLKALERKEIIQSLYTLIDYSKLGILCFRVYFKVSYVDEKRIKQLITHLSKDPHTGMIATLGGRHDLLCTFYYENPSRFNKGLRLIMSAFPEQLQNYTILTTVVNHYFSRKYLTNTPEDNIYGGDRKIVPTDARDKRILAMLAEDARCSSVAIAAKIGLTPKSVLSRMQRLKKERVIMSYRPRLDIEKLGGALSLLAIRYHNVTTENEDSLVAYLNQHARVVWVTKTFGEWDIELAIEADSERQLRQLEVEIRQRFGPLIQSVERIRFYDVHKLTYFPAFLAEDI